MTKAEFHDLVSDLIACALIEGARQESLTARVETITAKQKVLDAFENRPVAVSAGPTCAVKFCHECGHNVTHTAKVAP